MPPNANAECVGAMEDGLEVSTRPYDPQRPVVGLGEASQPLVADTRVPIPAAPGPLERIADEDERHGTANRLMVCAPLAGPRPVTVTDRRTAIDFAPVLRDVVAMDDPHAETIVLVMDHLNPQQLAALSEACAPAEARRLLERLERHHTPTQGSWLHRAATERRVLVTNAWTDGFPTRRP
jgi:DDE superfamily endonuclease